MLFANCHNHSTFSDGVYTPEEIIDLAKKCDADIVGFAPASRFDKNDAIIKIFPNTKTVIGLGFRILRGFFRGVEEGTTYYQYTTMGVENLEETMMPMAAILKMRSISMAYINRIARAAPTHSPRV